MSVNLDYKWLEQSIMKLVSMHMSVCWFVEYVVCQPRSFLDLCDKSFADEELQESGERVNCPSDAHF